MALSASLEDLRQKVLVDLAKERDYWKEEEKEHLGEEFRCFTISNSSFHYYGALREVDLNAPVNRYKKNTRISEEKKKSDDGDKITNQYSSNGISEV
ncbi:hypothetical protein MKX01_005483 [Papaver californicum]|nr:hypothetical protein MKX01_005483 [Papaver californicum]